MKNRKGFTLIEIIICIGIIAVISVSSIIGFNFISKNIRITKLKEIEDDILTAAKIYLETNDTAYQQLYSKENAVVVPLNVLVNEGLLDLKTTDLKQSDIEDEYVITALSTKTAGGDCINITSNGSWNLSKDAPLYICTDSNGNSNLSIIGAKDIGNLNNVQREPFVYKGGDPNNYIQYVKDGTLYDYRIYYVDVDDSLVLVSDNSFGNVFEGKTDNLCGISIVEDECASFPSYFGSVERTSYRSTCLGLNKNYYSISKIKKLFEPAVIYGDSTRQYYVVYLNSSCQSSDINEKYVSFDDYKNTFFMRDVDYSDSFELFSISSYLSTYFDILREDDRFFYTRKFEVSGSSIKALHISGYKIRLKSCMKIIDGTGNKAEPYILSDSGCKK